MDKIKQVEGFLYRAASDSTLGPSHVSLCAALCATWIQSGMNNPFKISRRHLMKYSKIKSTSTYHKLLNDLQTLKYFVYLPSYHPTKGSLVLIVNN